MSNEPNDDLFKNFAKVMEDFISNLPLDENVRFVGCTIIGGQGWDKPRLIPFDEYEDDAPDDDIEYEMIDAPDKIYITAELLPETEGVPEIEISTDTVRISVDDREVEIDLPCGIQAEKSTSVIRNGIIDIICEKT